MLSKALKYLLLDRVANKRGYQDHREALAESQQLVIHRAQKVAESEKNREQLLHIIGIERWSQSRVRQALGGPTKVDEYDGYRPDSDRAWTDLIDDLQTTQAESRALFENLQDAGADLRSTRVEHKQFGPLSLGSWLRYIESHANFESKRLG